MSPIPADITKTRQIPVPRPDVWTRLTTSDGAAAFFSPAAHIELRRGGPYEIFFLLDADPGGRGSEGCRVLSYVEGEMLSFTWNAPPHFPEIRWQRSFVVIRLGDRDGGGTELRLTHTGWGSGAQWQEVRDYFERAWDQVLDQLERSFRSGSLWDAEESAAPPPVPPKQHYVYFVHPTRAGLVSDPTEAEQETIRVHAAYLRALLAEGRLVLAGRALDPPRGPTAGETLRLPTPGIVVFHAADDAHARRIMENDPAVRDGVFSACVERFALAYLEDVAG